MDNTISAEYCACPSCIATRYPDQRMTVEILYMMIQFSHGEMMVTPLPLDDDDAQ